MKLLLSFFLITGIGFGAIAATTQWDVRTTGSDSNGGGFNTASTGTDYSQQDAAQVTYTDLVIGATNTQATSAAFPFTALHVGNIVNITGGTGFTVQRVQVVSVATNTATFDKALGTAGSTGGTGKLGGSLASLQTAAGAIDPANTIHVKAGTYTFTATLSIGAALVIGYGSTHFDEGTKPLITTSTDSTALFTVTSYTTFRNFAFSTTATVKYGAFSNLVSPLSIINCKSTNLAQLTYSTGGGQISVVNTEVTGAANAIESGAAVIVVQGCYFHDNTIGIKATGTSITLSVTRTLFSNNATSDINILNATSNIFLEANDFTGIGSGLTAVAPYQATLVGNVFYGKGAYGITLTAWPNILLQMNNAFGANTSGNRNTGGTVGLNEVTLTANPFTSATNFALNSTAGGGTLLKGTGFPGVFPGGLSTGSLDIGAVQSAGGAAAVQRSSASVQ